MKKGLYIIFFSPLYTSIYYTIYILYSIGSHILSSLITTSFTGNRKSPKLRDQVIDVFISYVGVIISWPCG